MSQYRPYSGFKWLNQKEIDEFDVNLVSENSSHGYIVKVDLQYPDELHGLHNDYLLVPEKLEISCGKYCRNIADQYSIKVGSVNKLVPNFGNKGRYVLHYRNLQLYLSFGMKLIGVRRSLRLEPSDRLKKYIDFNTDKKRMLLIALKKI